MAQAKGGLRSGALKGGGDKKSWTEVVLIVKSRDLCQPLMVRLLITNLDLWGGGLRNGIGRGGGCTNQEF